MLNFLLSKNFVNKMFKGVIKSWIVTKLGIDMELDVENIKFVEKDGRLTVDIQIHGDMSSDDAVKLAQEAMLKKLGI